VAFGSLYGVGTREDWTFSAEYPTGLYLSQRVGGVLADDTARFGPAIALIVRWRSLTALTHDGRCIPVL
jgi:hypothetical protein